MGVGGMDDCRDGLGEPALDHIESRLDRPRIARALWPRRHAKETDERVPCKGHGLGSREDSLQPLARRCVMAGLFIRRVEQQVDVEQLHLPSSILRMISWSSISPAIVNALSMSMRTPSGAVGIL